MGGLKKYDFVTEIGGQRVEKADDAHVIIDRVMIGEVRVVHGVHFASWILDSILSLGVMPRPKLGFERQSNARQQGDHGTG